MNETLDSVGLFGTCGNSQWRDTFIARLKKEGIPFFNPQLPAGTWKPECAAIEANHLKNDRVVIFAVTDETWGYGSLAETGFSAKAAMQNMSDTRFALFFCCSGAQRDP